MRVRAFRAREDSPVGLQHRHDLTGCHPLGTISCNLYYVKRPYSRHGVQLSSARGWWALGDSNPRPLPCELPTRSCQTHTGLGNHSQSLDAAKQQGPDLRHTLAPLFRALGPNWVQSLSSKQGRGKGSKSPFLTVRQVAEILSINTATVYRLCAHGALPHVRLNYAIRVNTAHLIALVDRALGRPI